MKLLLLLLLPTLASVQLDNRRWLLMEGPDSLVSVPLDHLRTIAAFRVVRDKQVYGLRAERQERAMAAAALNAQLEAAKTEAGAQERKFMDCEVELDRVNDALWFCEDKLGRVIVWAWTGKAFVVVIGVVVIYGVVTGIKNVSQ